MKFDIQPCSLHEVRELVKKYHGYGAVGSGGMCFKVVEEGKTIAAFSWLAPPPGAAKSVCPEFPAAVLSLSRMVAVPKSQRKMKHISKPLKAQMKGLIDRTRWPVLITYSDSTLGHDGYVYKCSGWESTVRSRKVALLDSNGRRASGYSNGSTERAKTLSKGDVGIIQRWEHWVCERDKVPEYMRDNGWERVPILGKFYRSGNPAYTIRRKEQQ